MHNCRNRENENKQVIARRGDMPLPPADRSGSTSMRERIRSPRSSGGLRGICGAASLGASWLWDRRTDRDMA